MGFTRYSGLQEQIVRFQSDTAKTYWLRGIWLLSWLGLLSACAVAVPTPGSVGTPSDLAKIAPALQMALQGLDKGKPVAPHRLVQDTLGRIQVYVYVRHAPGKVLASLQQAGLARMVNVPELKVVEGWIIPSRIPALTGLPFVTRITLPRYARPR